MPRKAHWYAYLNNALKYFAIPPKYTIFAPREDRDCTVTLPRLNRNSIEPTPLHLPSHALAITATTYHSNKQHSNMARAKGILENLHGRLDNNTTICHRNGKAFTRPAHIRQPQGFRTLALRPAPAAPASADGRGMGTAQHHRRAAHQARLHHRPIDHPLALQESQGHPRPRRTALLRPFARIRHRAPSDRPRLHSARRHPLHLLPALHHRGGPPSRCRLLRRPHHLKQKIVEAKAKGEAVWITIK